MKKFILIILMDMKESVRARWFHLYSIVFGGLVVLLYWLGITESEIMGFTGVSRLLLTYIQLCIAVLPIFIMVATVRTVVGDRESNILEYYLSMPLSLRSYYWGKFMGRLLSVFIPIILVMTGAIIWGIYKELEINWDIFTLYCFLLISLSLCFLGFAFFVSSIVRRHDTGIGVVFALWMVLLAFLDIVLIGIFIQYQIPVNIVLGVALTNPLQVFRTAALSLFDPRMSALGPSAYLILDIFGKKGYIFFALFYPAALGLITSHLGFIIFTRKDMA